MPGRLSRAAAALLWIAFGWAVANCGYVYFVLHGQETHRIESAVFIFVLVGLLSLAVHVPVASGFGRTSLSGNSATPAGAPLADAPRPHLLAHPWAAGAVSVPLVLLCAASIALLVLIVLAVRRGSSRILAGPAVILASTLPVYAYFAVFPDFRSSRYIYFAGAGWALHQGVDLFVNGYPEFVTLTRDDVR